MRRAILRVTSSAFVVGCKSMAGRSISSETAKAAKARGFRRVSRLTGAAPALHSRSVRTIFPVILMAEVPHPNAVRARPLSPFVTIYKWTPTMASSITHRVTGCAMAAGTVLIAWWLIAAASGPDSYAPFVAVASNPISQIVLFGFTWALSFHLLNGIRHLAWDLGYGFHPKFANTLSVVIYVLSVLIAIGVFVFIHAQQLGIAL
jgi:succinate dehydrogenase / fumarate reductase cytochrome b subunit